MDFTLPNSISLSNCETEPICYPDAIQPHGVLLVLDPTDLTIVAASESCQALLGLASKDLLGQPLGQIFGPAMAAVEVADKPVPLTVNGLPFLARSCCNKTGQILVDIEPNNDVSKPDQTYTYRQGLESLRRLGTVAEITPAAAKLIRTLTGFDQVMIYRFDADWNGEVIAEACAENVTSYLGLNFPASDIPKPSRELFRLCRVRLIPDVLYAPSALLTHADPQTIDLGRSSLRSVSPMHIEYLKNMGTRATLVGALVIEDRLWGLVSCQHKQAPKYLMSVERDAFTWLCEDIAALMEARELRERCEREHSLALRRRSLMESIRKLEFKQLMRTDNNTDLLGVVGADGFALVVNDTVQTTGMTPDIARIKELYRCYLEHNPSSTLFASSALCRDFAVKDVHDGVAGALFVTVLRQPVVTMIWFRRERHDCVKWAGDPQHPHIADESGRLSPRKSFNLFLQEVRGQSLAFVTEELDSAAELVPLVEINALRESEALSRTILNVIPQHLCILDAKGMIVTINDAWKRFVQSNDTLVDVSVGMNYRDICTTASRQPHDDKVTEVWAGIEAVLSGQLPFFSIDYLGHSHGEQHWLRMSVFPMMTSSGCALVAHEDITERKLANLALARSESHLNESQNIAGFGSWEWDITGGENRWSDQQCRIFGYAPETVHPSYDLFFQAVHPDDQSKVKKALEDTVNGQAPYDIDFRIVRPDGSIRHIHSVGRVERDPAGTPLRMTGTLLDISQRVETQQCLEKLLAEQKTLLDNKLVGIAKVQNRTFIWANPALELMMGYGPGEMMGMDTRQGYVSEEAWRALGAKAYPLSTSGEIFRSEVEFVCKDGGTIWVDLSGTMLDLATGTSLWCYLDITDKKRTSDMLRESENRFRTMADSAPVLIWISGLDQLCYWFNKVWLDFTGRSMEQEMGNGWAEGVHAEDFDGCLNTYVTSFDACQPFAMEYRLRRFDGQYRWLLNHGVPQFDERNVFLGYIGTCIDITDTKQIALELQASQRRLTLAQEGAHIGIWEWDLITDHYNMMPECVRLLGIKSGEKSETVHSHIHSDDRVQFEERAAIAINSHESCAAEFRWRLDTGKIIWVLSRGSAQYDATGMPIKMSGIVLNITERKLIDAERDRLLKIIEESPDYIAMTDMQEQHIYMNKAGIQLLGLPDNFDSSTLIISDIHPPWAAERAATEVIPTMLKQGCWQGESAVLHRDGHEIPVFQVGLVHRDKFGHPEYFSTIMRDISQQKAAEIELTQAKEAAVAANRAKSAFLANMSHEIRTPMNGVVGMIDILQHTELTSEQRRMLGTIAQSSQALLHILNDILDYSKIEAGMLTVECIATSLKDVATSVVQLMQSTANTKSIDLSMWIAPELPHFIKSDPTRLRQVLFNLIGNAIKFTRSDTQHPGTVALRIETGTGSDGTAVVLLRVMDKGIGMSEEVVSKLFQPFTQADASTARQFGGTGLGLSISQRLVTLMGGQITVISTRDQGSEFTVTLPLRSAPPLRLITAVPERRLRVRQICPTVDEALAAHQLILLAEDNETNSDVLREQLHLLGYASEIAEDGLIALEMWKTGRYALLLTDCHMPGMDGFELTEAIRYAEPAGIHLPIIAVTASAMQGEALHCIECKMDDYLSKPLRLQELGNMLEKWLPLNIEHDEHVEPDVSVKKETEDKPDALSARVAIWDAGTLGQLVGDNPGMHRRLLNNFLQKTAIQVSAIEIAAQAGHMNDAANVAHTLKSAARTVGALALGDLCQQIETAGRSGEATACSAMIASLADTFAHANNKIQAHLALSESE